MQSRWRDLRYVLPADGPRSAAGVARKIRQMQSVGIDLPLHTISTPADGETLRVLGSGDVAFQAILERIRGAREVRRDPRVPVARRRRRQHARRGRARGRRSRRQGHHPQGSHRRGLRIHRRQQAELLPQARRHGPRDPGVVPRRRLSRARLVQAAPERARRARSSRTRTSPSSTCASGSITRSSTSSTIATSRSARWASATTIATTGLT